MALGASIYKVTLNLSNLNTHYYDDFQLTIAKHPSESESRMMYRILAFLHQANKDLEFTKGLSDVDIPELWQKDYSGDIIHWIDLGMPDEKRILKACSKSQKVSVFTYHYNKSLVWFEKIKSKISKNLKVKVYHLQVIENGPIEKLVTKNMNLSCIIEDENMYLSNDEERIGIEVITAKFN